MEMVMDESEAAFAEGVHLGIRLMAEIYARYTKAPAGTGAGGQA